MQRSFNRKCRFNTKNTLTVGETVKVGSFRSKRKQFAGRKRFGGMNQRLARIHRGQRGGLLVGLLGGFLQANQLPLQRECWRRRNVLRRMAEVVPRWQGQARFGDPRLASCQQRKPHACDQQPKAPAFRRHDFRHPSQSKHGAGLRRRRALEALSSV